MKNLLSLSVVFGLLACNNTSNYAAGPSNSFDAGAKTYRHETASNLHLIYDAAPQETLKSFQYVRLTGEIKNIGRDNVGTTKILLETSDPKCPAITRFSEPLPPTTHVGNTVVADCELGGKVFCSLALNFCKLQTVNTKE